VSHPRRSRSTWATVLLLAPFAFLGGMAADRAVFASGGEGTYRHLEVFTRVLAYIENNYVEDVSEQQLLTGAIKGMVATLDPHTVFMPADVFREMKMDTKGEFGGLGIEVTMKPKVVNGVRNELLTVVAPIDDTPAARAGVLAGDVILKIDGEPTTDLDLMSVVAKMRGPPGTKVVLTILRDGFSAPRDIVVVRDHIRVVSVEGRLYDGIGYVKVKNFQEQTDRYLGRALDDLRKENRGELRGLILDLRNNPGGLLDQAVRMADRFLPGGLVIVTTKGRDGRHVEEEKSHDRGTEPPYPMIVLVNGGSASASEIVAGALQDHGRAVLMGAQTFGKGSVQTLIELEDGSGLKLTIARYFTPKGRSIQEKGITPDVVVSDPRMAGREAIAPREVDLENHFGNDFERRLPARQQKQPAGQSEVEVTAKGDEEDYVLKTALDYLRTWQIFKANGTTSGKKSL
jgi:carboxyl-terminal processing protease